MSSNLNENVGKKVNKFADKKNDKTKILPFGCSSRIAVCIVFCILCCAAVFVAAKWDSISPEGFSSWFAFSGASSDDFPVDLAGTTVLENNIQCSGAGLIYVSDTSIVRLNSEGETLLSQQHNFINPHIKSSGDYAVTFNEGGGSYRIISQSEELYRGTQGSSISDCDITNSGIYAVISDQSGYLSKLSVFDSNNQLIYSYSFNDYYAISVALNDSGTKAVVGAVNTYNGEMISKVYLLDFTKTDPLNVFSYSNQIVYEVDFSSADSFAVITDSLVSVIDCGSFKEIPYSFDNKVLTSYAMSYDNGVYLSLSRSDDGRECSVVSLDKNGSEVNTFSTGLKITALNVYEDRIACLSESKMLVYNSYGDSFGEWDIGSDARNIILASKKYAYILGVSEIRRINLK